MMSEPGRQAFWFLILLLSLVSCQAGLAFSFLGATLRPALDNHHVMLDHYGQKQAILNVGKAGKYALQRGQTDGREPSVRADVRAWDNSKLCVL